LQYTFLSQLRHRPDFRQRLATLYEGWRTQLADGLAADLAAAGRRPAASPRAIAALIQGMLHGLVMQRAADPDAFDPEEMLQLCADMLGSYLGLEPAAEKRDNGHGAAANRKSRTARNRGGKP
jgi:hypothetical protein